MRAGIPSVRAMSANADAKCTQYPSRTWRNSAIASTPVPSKPSATGASSEYWNSGPRNQSCSATSAS